MVDLSRISVKIHYLYLYRLFCARLWGVWIFCGGYVTIYCAREGIISQKYA